jgi:DNA-binding CsgD family transcriptional regulator
MTQQPEIFDELTAREHDILELLARGYTNPEIGEHLGLTPKTVSNNISNVLLKVQATDRAKLTRQSARVTAHIPIAFFGVARFWRVCGPPSLVDSQQTDRTLSNFPPDAVLDI